MFRRRPPQYHQIIDSQPASLSEAAVFNGDGNGGPSGPTFSDSRFQLPYGRDIYDASAFASQNTRGFMSVAGEFVFTASQRKELERQLMICKYMMASVPIPSQLLLSSSSVKFSSGRDPEPWRCRRTDGKKWRCTKNAAPDHKYCERHAQKNKPRSRKPVEIQPPNPRTNDSPQPLGSGANSASSHNLVNMMTQFPSMASAAPYLQTGGIECITRGSGGPAAVSLYNQQRQQLMQSSSNGNGSLTLLPCLDADCQRYENHLLDKPYSNMVVDPDMGSFQGSLNAYTTQGTKPLFDAWSTGERGGPVEISKEASASSSMRLPLCSLSLLTPGTDKIDENEQSVMRTEMMDSVTWRGTTPGGPLGEALRLGLGSNERGSSSLVSPHCYSNSTTASSCSRSSCDCEDGSQAFNFIG